MTGQAIGPIIGGLLNIAWGSEACSGSCLSFVISVIVLSALLIFLPETQRSKAGNGSMSLSAFQKPLIYYWKPPMAWKENDDVVRVSENVRTLQSTRSKTSLVSFKKAFSLMAYLFEKDTAALLAWGAVAYTAWNMVTCRRRHFFYKASISLHNSKLVFVSYRMVLGVCAGLSA